MINNTVNIQKVIIAGAGPGDPELITVKAVRYLNQADVVLTDRLVSQVIIDTHVPATAEIVYVGKQNKNGDSFPQAAISALILKYALEGKRVVRLKGGDVAFFSNVLDELNVLVENDIPFEIIPGITAASGASAYAGIPITARGYATAARFITCYNKEKLTDDYWIDLATTDDTLVCYMSSDVLEYLVEQLTRFFISADKSMAIIEQATTPFQKVHIVDLYNFQQDYQIKNLASPTLIIIGKVVALHDKFGWVKNAAGNDIYFEPLNNTAHAG